MAKVLLHCPLNISRTIVSMMEKYCRQLEEKTGVAVQIETQPHRAEEKSLFKSYFEKGDIPDLTVGHVDDFADLPEGTLEKYFRPLPGRYPIRSALSDIGFTDYGGFFHPFVAIPFAIIYNRTMLSETDIPESWKDLLDERWQGRILMPDAFRIVSVVIKSFLGADFPDHLSCLEANFVHRGNPPEVVGAVDEGRFPLGITNIAFARISRQKNTRIIWPREGLFCMPQVMVWSRKAPDSLLAVGDFLMSPQVQEYLAMQSFIPAAPDVALHPLVLENNCQLKWKGWDHFLEVIKKRKNQ